MNWRRLRIASQAFFFALFLALGVKASQGFTGAPWNLFARFDPLTAVLVSLGSRKLLLAFFWGAALTVVLTLLLGRVFCGWVCPLGAFLEWTSRPIPSGRRGKSYYLFHAGFFLLVFMLLLAAVGRLWPSFLDPITIAQRALITSLHPAIGFLIRASGDALYSFGPLQSFVDHADRLWRWLGLLPQSGLRLYRFSLIFLGLILILAFLNRLLPRFWCRAICPLGYLLTLLGRLSPLEVRVDEEACNRCGICASLCPILPAQAERVDNRADCWRCADCIALCPQKAISFAWTKPRLQPQTFSPSRRAFLGGVLGAAAALAFPRADAFIRRSSQAMIRPPGARVLLARTGLDESEFLSRCIRCGLCWKVCPTNGLQPAGLEAGFEGFWTPILIPRIGYCDYGCTACGEVCPTGAIEKLRLEEKRKRKIGIAYIDQKRCIPYSLHLPCTVCEEMCPVPDKAIILEEEEREGTILRLPRVIPERCIGCGICENKCPVPGEAAIKVYTPFAV